MVTLRRVDAVMLTRLRQVGAEQSDVLKELKKYNHLCVRSPTRSPLIGSLAFNRTMRRFEFQPNALPFWLTTISVHGGGYSIVGTARARTGECSSSISSQGHAAPRRESGWLAQNSNPTCFGTCWIGCCRTGTARDFRQSVRFLRSEYLFEHLVEREIFGLGPVAPAVDVIRD